MKPVLAASFLISLAFGVAIWALSPLVTGEVEPWDAASYYYLAALIIFGLISGGVFPGRIWSTLLGLVLGQFGYMLIFLPSGPLIGVGLLSLFIYGLPMVAVASLSSWLRRMCQAYEMARGKGA